MLKKIWDFYKLGKRVYEANANYIAKRNYAVVPTEEDLEALEAVIHQFLTNPHLKQVAHALFLNNSAYFTRTPSRDYSSWLWQRDIYPWPENGPYPPELILVYCESLEKKLGIEPIKERL